MEAKPLNKNHLIIGAAVVLIGLLGYGGYSYSRLKSISSARITKLEQSLSTAEENLVLSKKENSDLAEAFSNEQSKNNLFEEQIRGLSRLVGELSGTVGVLQKLSQTDPELLKKYSKVYFLNENYVPSQLAVVDAKNIYDKDKPQQVHISVLPFLRGMISVAEQDGITLQVVSAYRSFGTQSSVKSGYKITYGAGTANQFSADQGYSEHQLGSALDFISPEIDTPFYGFEKTKSYKWLTENAHRFGFTLSYPPNNSYYQFEPWHWRFVGRALATKLYDGGKYFYDLPQREIDEYLVSIFD